MEGRQYYVCVDEGVYGNWRAIGVLEDLTTDEDVASFLVTLYSSGKQREGEESSLRCVDCHCPLTLYCSTCHRPSHLTLPPQPPPPSLTSPPPPPPPQVSDPSAPASVPTHTDHNPQLTPLTLSNDVKDEEDTVDSPQDEGGGDFDWDVVKTDSSVSACDNEVRSTEPAVTVHFVPTARAKHRTSRKRWTRKSGRKASGLEICDRSATTTTHNTRAQKAAMCNPLDQNESTAKVLPTNTHVRSTQKKKISVSEAKQVAVNKGDKEETCLHRKTDGNNGYATQEAPNHKQRKRKPCSSQDLEKGHILPMEERRSALIHVYDQSFIDRHRPDDESIDSSQPDKKHARQALIVKSVPKKRGRKKKRTDNIRRPASPRSSSCEEDTVDYQLYDGQSDHLTKKTQNSDDNFKSEPTNDYSHLHPTPNGEEGSDPDQCLNQREEADRERYPTLKHILSSPKMESHALDDEGNGKDGQPFRILVSALKILPLLTSSGNPAHNFYSYFECDHCRKAFTHKRAFNTHVQAHIDKRIHKCTFCDRSFERPCDRILHEKRHKYQCEVCGYKYLEYSMIKEHMKLHVMKCPGCLFETSDFDVYKKHKSTCECLKPTLQCEICGVRLKSQKALSFHIAAIHQNNRPFKCTLCDKSFVLQTKLNSHMRDVHAEGGKRFHCDKCGYRSFHAHSLKIHQMCVHSSERPHKCPHCPSAFARKVYLTIHLRKHTGEKPHRCGECLQTFTQRASLTRHIRTHHHAEPSDGRKVTDAQHAH